MPPELDDCNMVRQLLLPCTRVCRERCVVPKVHRRGARHREVCPRARGVSQKQETHYLPSFRMRICSRTPVGCFAPPLQRSKATHPYDMYGQGKGVIYVGLGDRNHLADQPARLGDLSGVAACWACFLLTCALLVTSSHSEGTAVRWSSTMRT